MGDFSNDYYNPYQSAKLGVRRFIREKLNLSPRVPKLFKVIRELPEGARVLDAGCGTGGFLELMEKENPAISSVGIDIGRPPSFASKGELLRGSVTDLPFDDDSFYVVTCSHVLEHLHDPGPCVVELLRVCKPEGTIYIETPSPRAATMPFFNVFWDDPTHVRPYSQTGLRRLFEMYGGAEIKTGIKKSLPAVLFGFPYLIIGKLIGDGQAKSMFAIYTFGFSVYAIAKKRKARAGTR